MLIIRPIEIKRADYLSYEGVSSRKRMLYGKIAIKGSGRAKIETPLIYFPGLRFYNKPSFSFGYEWVKGDTPFISVGVKRYELDTKNIYTGAVLVISADSDKEYQVNIDFNFVGDVLMTPQKSSEMGW